MVWNNKHIWHRSSHWKPQWFCGCPQGMVPWINVEDNPGPPWRKTMPLGWSCHAHPGMPPKNMAIFLDPFDVPWWELDFFGRWLERCVWWKFFSQFFFWRNKCKKMTMPRSMPWTSTRSPKKLCFLTSCPLNFCAFCLDVLSKSFAQMAFHLHVTNVLLGPWP